MIGYITLGTNQLDEAGEFYDSLLEPIGATRVFADERMIIWGDPQNPGDTKLSVITPYKGQPATVGNGSMAALLVEDKSTVELMYRRGLELGGESEG